MPNARIDIAGLDKVRARLGEVAIDPTLWVDVMEDACRAVGASAAVLLQADARTPDVPATRGCDDLFSSYFYNGWHERDVRAERAIPLIARGASVIIDQDVMTPDELTRQPFYAEHLRPRGYQWFGAIVFHADSALWAFSIQRTIKEGPFVQDDKRMLTELCRPLTEAATLSTAVGRVSIASATNALNGVHQPAIAVDRQGVVLEANAGAVSLFDDTIRIKDRRLFVGDRETGKRIDEFVARMASMPDLAPLPTGPMVVRRKNRSPIIIRVMPVPPAARNPFLGARALMTFTPVEAKPGPCAPLLERVFGLTPAEARLASLMAEGTSPEAAAEELGIARETARNQLKAVFAKTDTHRQSELVALLSRL